MCYFIHLAITPQRKPVEAQSEAQQIAKRHNLYLRGQYPYLAITDGHCSCDLVVPKGVKAPVPDFLRELVQSEAVKNVQVGWLFGDEMPEEAEVERLSIAEFVKRNEDHDLTTEIWYRLHDSEKYRFEPSQPAT